MFKTAKARVKCFQAPLLRQSKRVPVLYSQVSEQALHALAEQSMKRVREGSKGPATFVEI